MNLFNWRAQRWHSPDSVPAQNSHWKKLFLTSKNQKSSFQASRCDLRLPHNMAALARAWLSPVTKGGRQKLREIRRTLQVSARPLSGGRPTFSSFTTRTALKQSPPAAQSKRSAIFGMR